VAPAWPARHRRPEPVQPDPQAVKSKTCTPSYRVADPEGPPAGGTMCSSGISTWRMAAWQGLCTTSPSPTPSVHTRARWWRWGDSNPRPKAIVRVFSGRSLRSGLTSRLPQAEDLSASPGSLSGGGPRAEPPPW